MTDATLKKRLIGLLINALATSGNISEDDLIQTAEFVGGFIENDIIVLPKRTHENLIDKMTAKCYWECVNHDEDNDKKAVRCAECEYLMFSDCYGECSKGYKGIVNPNDTCKYGKLKKQT